MSINGLTQTCSKSARKYPPFLSPNAYSLQSKAYETHMPLLKYILLNRPVSYGLTDHSLQEAGHLSLPQLLPITAPLTVINAHGGRKHLFLVSRSTYCLTLSFLEVYFTSVVWTCHTFEDNFVQNEAFANYLKESCRWSSDEQLSLKYFLNIAFV